MYQTEVITGFAYLAPWLVFTPVIGLLLNMIFGGWLIKRSWGEAAIGTIASVASGTTFLISVLLAYTALLNHGEAVRWELARWIHVGTLDINWTFRIDTLSTAMMLLVSGVGTLIHIYAIGYMHEDVRHKHQENRFARFFVFLNLFIAMMMILVSGDSYLMLFVGWEGVGLCSFLLIGFWFEMDTLGRPSWANSDAAKKAMIANRVGDFGFLIAAFLMFWTMGSLQFDQVFEAAKTVPPGIIAAICLFLLIGVTGKSAQIPLYVWLPDAMAGPTPVSALIHAATMVTAGVYLITRSADLYNLVPNVQYIVSLIGAVTALFAATIAVAQYDIKKVLAYSTISQLGFMVAAVGMGAYVAGMFHLITHAFFKALLFLSAGSVLLGVERGHHNASHGHHEEKHGESSEHEEVFDPGDMRNMGGMRKTMPVTFWVYIIGTLALAGIVPFAGFWSKDEILLDASHRFPLIYWLLTIAAFLTAFYMGRQILMVFFGEPRSEAAKQAKESPLVMTIPLMILAFLALFGGLFNLPAKILGLAMPGPHTLTHWLQYTLGELESLDFSTSVAGISTVLALVALFFAWYLFGRHPLKAGQPDPMKRILGPVYRGMENKWYVDELYNALINSPYRRLSFFLADVVDWRFWHDWFHEKVIAGTYNWLSNVGLNFYVDQRFIDRIANGLGNGTKSLSGVVRRIQNGFVRSYALSVLFGVVIILGYLILR
jgi:NADH-quinone oxidoreductase subunit L